MGLSCSKIGSKIKLEITLGQWQILLSDDLNKINDLVLELKEHEVEYNKNDQQVIKKLVEAKNIKKE